jgi:hypothetical protein
MQEAGRFLLLQPYSLTDGGIITQPNYKGNPLFLDAGNTLAGAFSKPGTQTQSVLGAIRRTSMSSKDSYTSVEFLYTLSFLRASAVRCSISSKLLWSIHNLEIKIDGAAEGRIGHAGECRQPHP